MPGRVEQHADVVLRLEIRLRRTEFHRVRDGSREIAHLEVEVKLHLLSAVRGRPDRAHVPGLALKRNVGNAFGAQDGGALLAGIRTERPAEQVGIKPGQRQRLRRVEHHAPVIVPGLPRD